MTTATFAAPTQWRFREPTILPGFRLTLGFTLAYLGLIILVPLAALGVRSTSLGVSDFVSLATDARTLAALRLSFGAAFLAAALNAVLGVLVAWVLVRYRFPGRRVIDAMIDLPFALPTAVAGIALAALYGPNAWFGAVLAPFGVKVAYTPLGVIFALVFVTLPFVVRTVQPVMEELDREVEEAAATLGAGRRQTLARIIFPCLAPAILTGFTLALARGVGEYGSVIFIAGNLPYVSEIAPLLIVIKLEEFNYDAATAIGVLMLMISFALLLVLNLIQSWNRSRYVRNS